jgi:hypothetical protein
MSEEGSSEEPMYSRSELRTWFEYQVADRKPEGVTVKLPSAFQIGEAVEVVTSDDAGLGGLPILNGYIYGVTFAGNGTVSYDVAVELGATGCYAILKRVRGSIRHRGSNDPVGLLTLEELVRQVEPELRRASFTLVTDSEV